MIKILKTNARGILCGESQPMCRYSDATVARARELRAAGMTCKAIAEELGVKNRTTVLRWCNGERRRPHARIIAKRIRPAQCIPNCQQERETPVVEGVSRN